MFLPLNLIVRTTTDGAGIVAEIRRIVRSIDPGLPVANPMLMEEQFADLLISDRFGAVLMAALGLYGVMAYSVNQRVRVSAT